MTQCKQCGESKPITAFRSYYNGGSGHYTACKECESINSRRKYLEKKLKRTEDEQAELLLIYQLYEAQREKGLSPPRSSVKENSVKYKASQQLNKLVKASSELDEWLTKDLSTYAPDDLEKVYEGLVAKYRPRIGLDPVKVLPVYDETYRTVLDKILVRFDDYEEDYYGVE